MSKNAEQDLACTRRELEQLQGEFLALLHGSAESRVQVRVVPPGRQAAGQPVIVASLRCADWRVAPLLRRFSFCRGGDKSVAASVCGRSRCFLFRFGALLGCVVSSAPRGGETPRVSCLESWGKRWSRVSRVRPGLLLDTVFFLAVRSGEDAAATTTIAIHPSLEILPPVGVEYTPMYYVFVSLSL